MTRFLKNVDLVIVGIAVGMMLAALSSCATVTDHTWARPDDVDKDKETRGLYLICEWILDGELPDGTKVKRWLVCDYPERAVVQPEDHIL